MKAYIFFIALIVAVIMGIIGEILKTKRYYIDWGEGLCKAGGAIAVLAVVAYLVASMVGAVEPWWIF